MTCKIRSNKRERHLRPSLKPKLIILDIRFTKILSPLGPSLSLANMKARNNISVLVLAVYSNMFLMTMLSLIMIKKYFKYLHCGMVQCFIEVITLISQIAGSVVI